MLLVCCGSRLWVVGLETLNFRMGIQVRASEQDRRRFDVNAGVRASLGWRLTSGRYMHVRLRSDTLESVMEDSSEGLSGSPETCSFSTRQCFSLAKYRPVPLALHPPKFSPLTAGSGRRSSNDPAMAFLSICFNDRDSAEHVTTIFGSAWPSSTASFEFLEHADHVFRQPTHGDAQAPAVALCIINFLDEDHFLKCMFM